MSDALSGRTYKAVPKSWIKKRGRAYKMPREAIQNFWSGDPKAKTIIQARLLQQHVREANILAGMIGDLEAKFNGGCACRLCRRVAELRRRLGDTLSG